VNFSREKDTSSALHPVFCWNKFEKDMDQALLGEKYFDLTNLEEFAPRKI